MPVNSYQMINLAKTWGLETFQMVEMGRKINESMSEHVIELLKDAFKEKGMNVENSNILVLGVAYKPDVRDLQLSPAESIISSLKDLKANISIYDPFFKNELVFGINTESEFLSAVLESDAIVIVTAPPEALTGTIVSAPLNVALLVTVEATPTKADPARCKFLNL